MKWTEIQWFISILTLAQVSLWEMFYQNWKECNDDF